jgi:hypothetical protein
MPFRMLKVLTPAKTYDLVTRDAVKAELGLQNDTDYDAWIDQTIPQVSALIAQRTQHVFPIETVQESVLQRYAGEWCATGGPNAIGMKLKRWPVVVLKTFTANSVSQVEGTDFAVDYDNGLLTRLSASGAAIPWYGCRYPFAITYASGHAVKATQTGTIAADTPITIEGFELDCGVAFDDGTALVPVTANPATGEYTVSAQGSYAFSDDDTGRNVNIAWAKTAIPGDMIRATLRVMTMVFEAKGHEYQALLGGRSAESGRAFPARDRGDAGTL